MVALQTLTTAHAAELSARVDAVQAQLDAERQRAAAVKREADEAAGSARARIDELVKVAAENESMLELAQNSLAEKMHASETARASWQAREHALTAQIQSDAQTLAAQLETARADAARAGERAAAQHTELQSLLAALRAEHASTSELLAATQRRLSESTSECSALSTALAGVQHDLALTREQCTVLERQRDDGRLALAAAAADSAALQQQAAALSASASADQRVLTVQRDEARTAVALARSDVVAWQSKWDAATEAWQSKWDASAAAEAERRGGEQRAAAAEAANHAERVGAMQREVDAHEKQVLHGKTSWLTLGLITVSNSSFVQA